MQEEKNKHFIRNIEIKNFKCFDNFKAEGFGRVNLIGGKNNVGKTAFMEACSINIYSQSIESMTMALRNPKYRREKLNLVKQSYMKEDTKKFIENMDGFFSESNIKKIEFIMENSNGIKNYIFDIDNQKNKINSNEFSYDLKHINNIIFIDSYGFRDKDINEAYVSIQESNKEEELNRYINLFDNNIQSFKIFTEQPIKPKCQVQNIYRDLNEFGDGVRHYISIICSLYACKNSYLFIDEIGNGIHYTNLDKLWEIILTISKEQNVQVFATTHSDECIRALVTANTKDVKTYQLKEHILEDDEIKFIELGRTNGKVDSIIFDFKELENEVAQNMEIRGW